VCVHSLSKLLVAQRPVGVEPDILPVLVDGLGVCFCCRRELALAKKELPLLPRRQRRHLPCPPSPPSLSISVWALAYQRVVYQRVCCPLDSSLALPAPAATCLPSFSLLLPFKLVLCRSGCRVHVLSLFCPRSNPLPHLSSSFLFSLCPRPVHSAREKFSFHFCFQIFLLLIFAFKYH
jgi:hypothetical protein